MLSGHSVPPFSLACVNCDMGEGIPSQLEAEQSGWRDIALDLNGLSWNYLGVCPDTCHHAVRWESGAAALDRYAATGIPVPKIQLSSALEADRLADLQPFAEPRYLHQVVGRDGGEMLDLGMDGSALRGPLRCHFHVPVHKEEVGGCRTTRREMDLALDRAIALGATLCLEIETYTWDVLPLREGELLDSLEAEFRYVLGRIRR